MNDSWKLGSQRSAGRHTSSAIAATPIASTSRTGRSSICATNAMITTTSARTVATWPPVIIVYAIATAIAGGAAHRAGRTQPPNSVMAASLLMAENSRPATTAR